MESTNYNKRTFLNPPDSHYTGSIVCHDGVVKNRGQAEKRYTFVEISDCHGKVRLHSNENDGEKETLLFVAKLHKTAQELLQFADYLMEKEDAKRL